MDRLSKLKRYDKENLDEKYSQLGKLKHKKEAKLESEDILQQIESEEYSEEFIRMRDELIQKLPKKRKVNIEEKHSITKIDCLGEKINMTFKENKARDMLELKEQQEKQRL